MGDSTSPNVLINNSNPNINSNSNVVNNAVPLGSSPHIAATANVTFVNGTMGIRFPSMEEDEWTNMESDALQVDAPLSFDIPFAPYSRTEKLGHIADWTSPMDGPSGGTSYRKNFARPTAPRTVDDEEAGWSFAAADAKVGKKSSSTSMGGAKAPAQPFGRSTNARGDSRYHGGRGGHGHRRGGWTSRFADRHSQRKRDPSIFVASEWKLLEEIEFNRLAKLQLDPDDSEAILLTGLASVYDRANDKISTKHEKVIQTAPSAPIRPHHVPLEEDQTLLQLATQHGAVVVITDTIASLLMASPRTVIPWDVCIKRRGDLVIIDKRPNADIDLLPINETAVDAPADATSSTTDSNVLASTTAASASTHQSQINTAPSLANEAARITLNLSKALARADLGPIVLGRGEGTSEHATCYSKLKLGDGSIILIKSHLSTVMLNDDEKEYCQLATLLEYEQKGPSAMDWRHKLDSQRGAIFANEIRNNGAFLARVAFRGMLSAVQHIKLAYASRVHPKDTTRHALLGVHDFEPYELANQMNLNVPTGFGILRALTDMFRRLPTNCDYVLLRDPNKPMLRLFKMPGGEVDPMAEAIDELLTATDQIHFSNPSDVSDSE